MLQGFPTKHGTGISIYGDNADLRSLYQTIHKIAERTEKNHDDPLYVTLMAFAYEIRKAFSESRLKEKLIIDDHENECLGFHYLWTDLLITLSVLRHEAGYVATSKIDQANLYLLESVTKHALETYDLQGARTLKEFIGQRIPINNPLLMQINQFINMEYLKTSATKTRFRTLHRYFNLYFSPCTPEYQRFKQRLDSKAAQL